MKKKAVIFFNCQGSELKHHLTSSNKFNSTYDIYFIPLYEYILPVIIMQIEMILWKNISINYL